jgi:hypothetical protein
MWLRSDDPKWLHRIHERSPSCWTVPQEDAGYFEDFEDRLVLFGSPGKKTLQRLTSGANLSLTVFKLGKLSQPVLLSVLSAN